MAVAMRRFSQRFLQWLFIFGVLALVLTCFVLSGCASQVQTPKQVKVEADFGDCAKDLGARGPTLTYLGPNGDFRWRPGASGEVSIAQEKTMVACMRAKGYRFYDGPTPR
jgi:hypothetical protein